MARNDALGERVLVLAPTERDERLTLDLVAHAGLQGSACRSVDELVDELERGAGVLLVTEEVDASPSVERLVDALATQSSWSDIPLLVLAHPSRDALSFRHLGELSGITLLDRPVRTRTLVSALRTALRARRRQYQLRAQLRAERALQQRLAEELAGMHRLHVAGARLARSLALDEQLAYVVDVAIRVTDASAAAVELVADGTGWRVRSHRGLPAACAARLDGGGTLVGGMRDVPAGTAHLVLSSQAAQAGLPSQAAFADLPAGLHDAGATHATIAPITASSGQLLGALTVLWARPPARPDTSVLLLDLLARLTAGMLERERHEAEQRDADRRKDEFLATLAHELRNPLAPIRQAVRVARSDRASADQQRWSHGVIDRQVRHMALLLDDLLDLSRITRGKLAVRPERVTVKSIVDAAVETSAPLFESRRHSLAVRLPEQPVWIEADPVRLAQVVSNLLNNAAKYTDPGGHVTVRVTVRDGHVAIAVDDDGIGIEPDALARVFEMFAQVDSALERADGGLGIGLALVRGLVELHGGRVDVHSAGKGRGSTFTVHLPVAAPDVLDERADSDEVEVRDGHAAHRILVADDNVDAAQTLATMLRLAGHEVGVVHDGRAAIDWAVAERPEIVILDIGMPSLDGHAAAREIRSRHPQAMLIAVTGWGQEEDLRRSRDSGFDAHLTKPIDPDALLQLLSGPAAHAATRVGRSAAAIAATWRSSVPQHPPTTASAGREPHSAR